MEFGNEYVMSRVMYDNIVRALTPKGKKLGNPKAKVVEYLNQTAGIKGEIFDVIIKG